MALQIIWTSNALEDYRQVVDYLLKEWPLKTTIDFVITTEERVQMLGSFPYIGIASIKDPKIRSIVITKHNKLYYRISEDKIEILDIFDTRQDPAKNIYE
ncbi:MAG: type II toxin-antitoxin system RelE/ParE family toxin [Chitinophagaceae bacterium]|nr:MAG: type II toxin-antitoxin system RelE/ParE family toxin [Chitinophagaceae bacterium]